MNKVMLEVNSKEELKEIINKNEGVLIVDFTSPTCPPCLMLVPIFEQLVDEGHCSVVKINVHENHELATEYNVSATPTIFIYKDNQLKLHEIGFKPLEAWHQIIKKI